MFTIWGGGEGWAWYLSAPWASDRLQPAPDIWWWQHRIMKMLFISGMLGGIKGSVSGAKPGSRSGKRLGAEPEQEQAGSWLATGDSTKSEAAACCGGEGGWLAQKPQAGFTEMMAIEVPQKTQLQHLPSDLSGEWILIWWGNVAFSDLSKEWIYIWSGTAAFISCCITLHNSGKEKCNTIILQNFRGALD